MVLSCFLKFISPEGRMPIGLYTYIISFALAKQNNRGKLNIESNETQLLD